jgi:hypothetical protein
VHRLGKGRTLLLALLGTSLTAAGCGNDRPAASRSPVHPVGVNPTNPAPSLPAPTVTTLATPRSFPPTTASNPSDCQSGSVALAVSLGAAQRSVCLRTGATLTVLFDKSGRGGMGLPQQWAVPPIRQDQPILSVISTSPRGSSLTAVFKAETPGSTTVYANYEEGCSAATTTPCTVPPLGMLALDVTVVSS